MWTIVPQLWVKSSKIQVIGLDLQNRVEVLWIWCNMIIVCQMLELWHINASVSFSPPASNSIKTELYPTLRMEVMLLRIFCETGLEWAPCCRLARKDMRDYKKALFENNRVHVVTRYDVMSILKVGQVYILPWILYNPIPTHLSAMLGFRYGLGYKNIKVGT